MVDNRSVITVNVLDETFNAIETPDAIDKTNDHEIVLGEFGGSLLLLFHLSAATAADTITIVAGTEDPAFRRGLGDLAFEATGGAEEVVFGPVETARFLQADGKIYIDIAGSTIAGTIEAYRMP